VVSADVGVVQSVLSAAIDAHQRFSQQGLEAVAAAAAAVYEALKADCKLLTFGNGGSAADAQHLVAELVGRFEGERRPLPAVALTADSSVVTAVANDYGYDQLFSRQIQALGSAGDVAFGISTSGRSWNVASALTVARGRGLKTIALTGRDGGPVGAAAQIHINVAESSTARVQEVHRTVLHAMCSLIELALKRDAPEG
jgi:phosphoheptose isomerase